LRPFIAHVLPPAVVFQRISLVVEAVGKVLNGLAFDFQPFCPDTVPALIPVLPLGIYRALARCYTGGVGQYGFLAGEHFISYLVLLVDEIHHPLEGHYLDRLVAYIEIEGSARFGRDVSKRGGSLDDGFFTVVVEPGHAGSYINGCDAIIQIE
jgi:hypothetical protein